MKSVSDQLNKSFTQLLLRTVLEDLTVAELRDYRANAWVICLDKRRGEWEFQWPGRGHLDKTPRGGPKPDKPPREVYYWYDRCDNAFDCRARALENWLTHFAPEQRKR